MSAVSSAKRTQKVFLNELLFSRFCKTTMWIYYRSLSKHQISEILKSLTAKLHKTEVLWFFSQKSSNLLQTAHPNFVSIAVRLPHSCFTWPLSIFPYMSLPINFSIFGQFDPISDNQILWLLKSLIKFALVTWDNSTNCFLI